MAAQSARHDFNSTESLARPFKQYLNAPRIYSCGSCRSHVSDHEEIISKAFQGRHGRAYLFSNAINISLGPSEDRLLITGLHTVADIYCTCCNTVLGWKYVRAYEESQRYKEGNYIIEKQRVMKVCSRISGIFIKICSHAEEVPA